MTELLSVKLGVGGKGVVHYPHLCQNKFENGSTTVAPPGGGGTRKGEPQVGRGAAEEDTDGHDREDGRKGMESS